MVKITDHFQRALSLLVSQFRQNNGLPPLNNIQKLIKVICTPVQLLENIKWQLKTERSIDTAIGKQLDLIGEILGLPRNENESDESYRDRLRLQAFINSSKATPEYAIQFLKMATRATNVIYRELHPACFQLETDGTFFPYPPNILNDALKQITPAGVNYVPITATYGVTIPFRMSQEDFTNALLAVEPESGDYSNLRVDPYNYLIEISDTNIVIDESQGGFGDEGFPSPGAGTLAELIQKNGNFPPRRYV